MRVRATHLGIADKCTGAPALLRELDQKKRQEGPPPAAQAGLIVHEWIAIALTIGEGVAWRWLGDDPIKGEIETFWEWWLALESDMDPDPLVQVEEAHTLEVPHGVVSMRFDAIWGNRLVDWKHGLGAKYFLPPVYEDLQMMSYAVALWERDGWDSVEVHRVRTSDLEIDSMTMDRAQLIVVKDWIAGIVADVAAKPDTRTPGIHCESCWARKDCPERLELLGGDAGEVLMVRFPGEVELGPQSARLWAQHRQAVRDRADQLDKALERYLNQGGSVVADGKVLKAKRYQVDRVADHEGLILEVARVIGGNGASALRTSKSAVMDALKKAKIKPAERDRLFERWREGGLIEPSERVRISWVKS